jgi:hypothetical protein
MRIEQFDQLGKIGKRPCQAIEPNPRRVELLGSVGEWGHDETTTYGSPERRSGSNIGHSLIYLNLQPDGPSMDSRKHWNR